MRSAISLELGCWLAAGVLALALLLAAAPNTPASPQPNAATAATPAPHLSIYQQHCMERILARALGKTEESVANLINQLCIAPFAGRLASAAGQALPSCDRLFTMRLTPVAKPVAGCLGG
jgi:hypothetical protein